MLPAPNQSKTYRHVERDFSGGMWHRYGQRERSFYDCENVSTAQYPAIVPRTPRRRWMLLSEGVQGMHCSDALYIASGGELSKALSENHMQVLGVVNDKEKVFGSLGSSVLVLPDFKVYDTESETLTSKHVKLTLAGAIVQDQSYVDTDGVARTVRCNTLHCVDYNFKDFFAPGDAVRISGTEGNDGYYTLRAVEEFDLRFDENALVAQDMPICYVSREAPALKGMCTVGDRLWGFSGNTIYVCAPGDVSNWYRYDSDAQSSFAITVADMGAFTGCVVHQGHPVFFKSNCMVEVMGDSPENYTVVQTCLSGVAEGSGASLCSVGGSMLYLSENGVVSCSGSSVKSISEALGQQLTDGIGTTDGRLYYLSAKDATGMRALYVYDTETHAWAREEGENIVYLGHIEGDTYAYCSNHVIDILGKDITHHGTSLGMADSFVEFAELCDDSKGEIVPVRLGLRVWCDADSPLTLFVRYNGGEWEQRATLQSAGERLWYVPLAPRACHSLGVRVQGKGNYRICALIREYK